jgi:cytochrome bd-type quinol oxidase subunit 2
MQKSVAKYGKLLLIIGVAGYLAGGMQQWATIAPALLGIIAVTVTCGPLRTSSEMVAAVAGTLIALLALFGSAGAVADMPAVIAGDPNIDGPLTLSRSLTSLVSLSVLLALAAQWLQGDRART